MTSPQNIIATIISMQSGQWAPIFGVPTPDLMSTYFSTGFVNDWTNAMAYNNINPVFDGDPISGYMSVTSLSLTNSTVTNQTSATAVINSVITVTLSDAIAEYQTTDAIITFTLIVQANIWVVDDINNNITSYDVDGDAYVHPSLRTYFQGIIANPNSFAS